MISQIEALRFRCLKYIRQPLEPFHILVGPNASGKTTFLDVIAFLGQLVSEGLEAAISERTQNFQDLVWGRSGEGFELAVEAEIPGHLREKLAEPEFDTARYEIALRTDLDTGEVSIGAEKVALKVSGPTVQTQRSLFPEVTEEPATILTPPRLSGTRIIINKVPDGNDNFYSEAYPKTGKGWVPAFKFGPRKSALANLPGDESKFPVSTWLRTLLSEGVQALVLNSLVLRKASPPGQVRRFKPDGSNLPWVINNLRKRKRKTRDRFWSWIGHLQTALPDIEDIGTTVREDDRHCYLTLCYKGGLKLPSWVVSDGTLRLLALTLPAYLPDFKGIYLIEEPENGIHPRAVETMFQSLSSVYNAQILLATHSPVILSVADPSKVLCFAKTPEGATDIVVGSQHPALKDWRGETNLGVLFAGGVLG